MAFLGNRIQTKTRFNMLFNPSTSSSSSSSHLRNLLLRRTLKMSTTQWKSKRPICPSCSKPARTCLCSRIRVSGIENSVNVTILQHALECKHPLNSTRIARLGLKNLTVATVSDVNFEARFVIRLMDPNEKDRNLVDSAGKCSLGNGVCDGDGDGDGAVVNGEVEENSVHPDFDSHSGVYGENQKLFSEKDCNLLDEARKCGLRNSVCDDGAVVNDEVEKNSVLQSCGFYEENGGHAISVTIGKYGVISSLSHIWMPQSQTQSSKLLSFSNVLAHREACEALSKGFLVKKLQSRKLGSGIDLEECEEFELEVPPGSVLLFPSDKSVSISELVGIGFEVKNLIVLDGTWAKAKRVYSENPWLNILPHLKLQVNEVSLYSDVRKEPKAGYLSTIESIVHALKAFGENHEGLDGLLDTFESMVGDQTRCKDERLSKLFHS